MDFDFDNWCKKCNCKKYDCIYYEKIFHNYYCRIKDHDKYVECVKSENHLHYHNKSDLDFNLFDICICGEVVFNYQHFCYKCNYTTRPLQKVNCDCGMVYFMSKPYFFNNVWAGGEEYRDFQYKRNDCPSCGKNYYIEKDRQGITHIISYR